MTTPLSKETRDALKRLEAIVADAGSMIVAYSGGVDSALLVSVAHRVLGEKSLAVLGVSASLSSSEREKAVVLLEEAGIAYTEVHPDEMEREGYRANAGNRCYFCKEALFDAIDALPERGRYETVAYGANLDDEGDHRPGARSASGRGVIAPLRDAGMTKAMVREAARALGLPVWDKPAAPCLASRIPYFQTVTPEKLAQIERAERVLDRMGFDERRVRHHGDTARVELPLSDHGRACEAETWNTIVNEIAAAGFKHVELEAGGLRSGRLNDALPRPS